MVQAYLNAKHIYSTIYATSLGITYHLTPHQVQSNLAAKVNTGENVGFFFYHCTSNQNQLLIQKKREEIKMKIKI